MANILTDLLETRDLTPILFAEKNKQSSLQGESQFSVEKIVIKTDYKIRKEGSKLFINKEEINLEQMNVLDLLILLKKKGLKVAFVNNTDYWYYPALCLLDFSNTEVYEEELQSNPTNLKEYKYLKNLSISNLDSIDLKVLRIFNIGIMDNLPFRIVEDTLIIERGYKEYCRMVFSVTSKEFTLRLGSKFSTQEVETVSRYLEKMNDQC